MANPIRNTAVLGGGKSTMWGLSFCPWSGQNVALPSSGYPLPFIRLPLASILRVKRISKTITDEVHAHHGE
jgi:hypothetical protein